MSNVTLVQTLKIDNSRNGLKARPSERFDVLVDGVVVGCVMTQMAAHTGATKFKAGLSPNCWVGQRSRVDGRARTTKEVRTRQEAIDRLLALIAKVEG